MRELLRVNSQPGSRDRPFLAPMRNPVQLSYGHETLVVWYPLDNYFDFFDAAGGHHSILDGCMPASTIAFYESSN